MVTMPIGVRRIRRRGAQRHFYDSRQLERAQLETTCLVRVQSVEGNSRRLQSSRSRSSHPSARSEVACERISAISARPELVSYLHLQSLSRDAVKYR